MSPSAVGPALVHVKFPPSRVSLIEKEADIKLGLLEFSRESGAGGEVQRQEQTEAEIEIEI